MSITFAKTIYNCFYNVRHNISLLVSKETNSILTFFWFFSISTQQGMEFSFFSHTEIKKFIF